jgi:hypothetical protein
VNKRMLPRLSHRIKVRIRPIERRFDGGPNGPELQQLDRDWLPGPTTKDGILMYHLATAHAFLLEHKHINHFDEDPRRGQGYGVLHLRRQLNLGGDHIWLTQ